MTRSPKSQDATVELDQAPPRDLIGETRRCPPLINSKSYHVRWPSEPSALEEARLA